MVWFHICRGKEVMSSETRVFSILLISFSPFCQAKYDDGFFLELSVPWYQLRWLYRSNHHAVTQTSSEWGGKGKNQRALLALNLFMEKQKLSQKPPPGILLISHWPEYMVLSHGDFNSKGKNFSILDNFSGKERNDLIAWFASNRAHQGYISSLM